MAFYTKKQKSEKYKQIEDDVNKLNESLQILNTIVREQQPVINTIEEEINQSKQETKKAEEELVIANNYSNSYMGYIGGMITGAVGIVLVLLVRR
jgi:t-SNARE complex subunit (syntaxin)